MNIYDFAFPSPGTEDPNGNVSPPEYGMSLRDYFAGQALAGLCADPGMDVGVRAVKLCYSIADEMMEERTVK